mgnify:CR=1 FL=1
MKRELKKSVIYALYGISFLLLVGGVIGMLYATKKVSNTGYQYVSKGILDYENKVEVVNTKDTIKRPYNDTKVSIVKSFYNYKDEAKNQEKSLIFYEGTYMQSSGISYSNGDVFDIVSILPGEVSEVKEDDILGNIITIKHSNNITSIYQSVKDISVKMGDKVTSGQTIAKSSTSNISKELNNHLYFELIIDGICVNPEEYFDKSVNEI